MTRANDASRLPERGPARWIMIGFMVVLAALLVGLIYLGQRTQRLSLERATLTAEMVTYRNLREVEDCLGRPSGKGLGLIRQRRGRPGDPLHNRARDFKTTFDPVESGMLVRLYSREGWPPGPQDIVNFEQCVGGRKQAGPGSSMS